jgi:hypothetical protein
MVRTTVLLPADLRSRASRCARERGLSLGALVRELLVLEVERSRDPLFADRAVYKGRAPRDIAARHDAHLFTD